MAACLLPGEDMDRYIPSINRMFVSASELFGSRAVAVVMTGMGNDGKEGVVKIKSAGERSLPSQRIHRLSSGCRGGNCNRYGRRGIATPGNCKGDSGNVQNTINPPSP